MIFFFEIQLDSLKKQTSSSCSTTLSLSLSLALRRIEYWHDLHILFFFFVRRFLINRKLIYIFLFFFEFSSSFATWEIWKKIRKLCRKKKLRANRLFSGNYYSLSILTSMVGSYFSTNFAWQNWTVNADLPTPPGPSTTTLYSLILTAEPIRLLLMR